MIYPFIYPFIKINMPKRIKEQISLTYPFVMALKPSSKAYEVFDARVGGFSVQVYPTGKKTYFVNYNVHGKRKRLRIGEPKLLKISEARVIAIQSKETCKSSINIAQEENLATEAQKVEGSKAQQTIATLADEFITEYCIGEGSEPNLKGWKEYLRILNKYVIPKWGNLPIEIISIGAVTKLLDKIAKKNGPYQSNRVLAVIRKLFNWARDKEIISYVPIAPKVAKKEKARTRFLNDYEIVKFWKACEKESYPFGKLFQLLLITGQRRLDVASMRWSQVDINKRVWMLPAHATKLDKTHLVPLSTIAIDLLNSMPRLEACDLVFPSSRNNNYPVSGFGKVKKRICTFETDWRLNDLRRTVRINFTRLEIDYMICNKVLGYIDQSFEGHYDPQDYRKQKKNALDKWAQLLTSILTKNIVALDKS